MAGTVEASKNHFLVDKKQLIICM